MITFSGSLAGKSEDFFWNKKTSMEKLILRIGGFSFLLSIPTIGKIIGLNKSLIVLIPIFIVSFIASFFIAKNKKRSERKNEFPYTIKIDDEYIEYKSFSKTEKKSIKSVKTVRNYEEFYYIEFNKSENVFVCQKDLLIEGDLKLFEDLFVDKLK